MDQITVLIAGKGLVLDPLGSSRLWLRLVIEHLRQPLAGLISFALARP
jgi:hypothetical protein